MRDRLRRIVLRLLIVGLWVGAVYYFFFGGEYDYFDLREVRAERDAVAERTARSKGRADSLERRADRLLEDPAALERTARERYGFIRDGERLYRFVEVEGSGPGKQVEEGGTRVGRFGNDP